MAAPSPSALGRRFTLDPAWTFLNHGSFGACPRPVLAAQEAQRRRLERQPVQYLLRDLPALLVGARDALAAAVGADPAGVALVANATTGVNVVARGLDLGPGDEVLGTDHEYGACAAAWRVVCAAAGARYVEATLPVPVRDEADVLRALAAAATPRTRVVFVSHITSATALVLPIAAIAAWARSIGARCVVDGAHGPGQVPLAIDALGVDAYAGNCHKWLCAPKGAGFLAVAPDLRERLRPLVVSWDHDDPDLLARHGWLGTDDPSAHLAVPAALAFQAAHGWDDVRARCHALAVEARAALAARLGAAPLSEGDGWLGQMAAAEVPGRTPEEVTARLLAARVEVPAYTWGGRTLVRASFQGYNAHRDLERLLDVLAG